MDLKQRTYRGSQKLFHSLSKRIAEHAVHLVDKYGNDNETWDFPPKNIPVPRMSWDETMESTRRRWYMRTIAGQLSATPHFWHKKWEKEKHIPNGSYSRASVYGFGHSLLINGAIVIAGGAFGQMEYEGPFDNAGPLAIATGILGATTPFVRAELAKRKQMQTPSFGGITLWYLTMPIYAAWSVAKLTQQVSAGRMLGLFRSEEREEKATRVVNAIETPFFGIKPSTYIENGF